MKKIVFIIMSITIVFLSGTCAFLCSQLKNANNLLYYINETAEGKYYEQITSTEEWNTWVSWSVYQDAVYRLQIAENLIFYVEEVLNEPYIDDYLNSDERKEWAKYH